MEENRLTTIHLNPIAILAKGESTHNAILAKG